jgi:hypothetical protein
MIKRVFIVTIFLLAFTKINTSTTLAITNIRENHNKERFTMQTVGNCNGSFTDNFSRTDLGSNWLQYYGKYEMNGSTLVHLHDDKTYEILSTAQYLSSSDTDLEGQMISGDFTATVDLTHMITNPTEVDATVLSSIGFHKSASNDTTINIHGLYIGLSYPVGAPKPDLYVWIVKDTGAQEAKIKVTLNEYKAVEKVRIERVGDTYKFYTGNSDGSFTLIPTTLEGFTGQGFVTLSSSITTDDINITANVAYDNLSIACGEAPVDPEPEPTGDEKVVYRFFNKKTGSWLYTDSLEEKNAVMKLTTEWTYEGEKFKIIPLNATNTTGTIPVYRFFNKCIGGHVFTISTTEKESISKLSCYTYEGEKFRVYDKNSPEGINIYRYFDTSKGYHLFTASSTEKSSVDKLKTFNYEGIAFKVISL